MTDLFLVAYFVVLTHLAASGDEKPLRPGSEAALATAKARG